MSNAFFKPAATADARTCIVCKETKELEHMAKSPQSKGGYRNLCRLCRNVQQIERKETRRMAAQQKVVQERETRRADPTLVQPRTFVHAASTWTPEPWNTRPDGKHIKSLGT